jgi:hypothetical protein
MLLKEVLPELGGLATYTEFKSGLRQLHSNDLINTRIIS